MIILFTINPQKTVWWGFIVLLWKIKYTWSLIRPSGMINHGLELSKMTNSATKIWSKGDLCMFYTYTSKALLHKSSWNNLMRFHCLCIQKQKAWRLLGSSRMITWGLGPSNWSIPSLKYDARVLFAWFNTYTYKPLLHYSSWNNLMKFNFLFIHNTGSLVTFGSSGMITWG